MKGSEDSRDGGGVKTDGVKGSEDRRGEGEWRQMG